jgi:hypothetical protein
VLVHDHEQGAIAKSVKGVTELDGDVGIDDLFPLRLFGLGDRDPDRGNIGHEYGGLPDLFEDHAREVGTARNALWVLVEVHCRSHFARGRLLYLGRLLQSLDGRI